MKVGVFVPFDLSRGETGTTIRAKTVVSCLDPYFQISSVGMSSTTFGETKWLIVKVPKRQTELFRALVQLPFWLVGTAQLLVRHRFDIVYVCNDWYGLIVYLIIQRVFKRKVIFEIHGISSEETKTWGKPTFLVWLLRCWEAIVLRQCDLTVALSGHIFEFCKRYTRRLELVPVFVDTSVYRRNEGIRAAVRERRGWQDKRVVGLIGAFDKKWNEYALEFLDENIGKFDERIQFVIIGKCERSKRVHRCLYAGFVEDLPGILSCLDAVLVARRLATSGPLNKIIQSMSCSLPVFTTPQGMIGMDYAHQGNDIIVAKENEMVRTVNSWIFDDDFMKTIGKNARQTVEKRYSNAANAAKLRHIVQSVL